MKLHFHQPPPAQRAGGLDAAIRSLQSAMEGLGHEVLVNPGRESTPPDAAHFHGLWQPAYCTLARQYSAQRVPFVVSPHGMLEPWAWRHKRWKKLPYWHLIEAPWIRRATAVLATASGEARRIAEFLPKSRVETLPLGLTGNTRPDHEAARARLGWKPEERVLLYLSRIHEKKGLDLLLEALAQNTVPQSTRMVVVGPEDQLDFVARCRDFARTNAARLPPIEWIGPVWGEERWPYLQGADLFCLPTHSENFGLAVLEASQVGTPALTTTETPWAETLPKQGGFIAKPTVESVAAELQKHFSRPSSSPADRTALSDWAFRTYAWENLGPRYAEFYGSLGSL